MKVGQQDSAANFSKQLRKGARKRPIAAASGCIDGDRRRAGKERCAAYSPDLQLHRGIDACRVWRNGAAGSQQAGSHTKATGRTLDDEAQRLVEGGNEGLPVAQSSNDRRTGTSNPVGRSGKKEGK